jgi:hypothetical protein
MRKLIIVFNLLGSAIVFGLSIDAYDSFVMFLLFGIVPGSETPLSASEMLALHATASFILIAAMMAGHLKKLAAQPFISRRA